MRASLDKQISLSLSMIFLAFVVFGVFSNGLSNGFVWDDEAQIVNNPWIKDIAYLGKMFSSHVFGNVQGVGTTNYYRPVAHLFYTVTWHWYGSNAAAFHVVNLVLHIAATLLVFVLGSRWLSRTEQRETADDPNGVIGALGAALYFGVHPVHAEAVNWISGIMELAYTVFGLLSFYFFLGVESRGGTARLCLSAVLFAMALFSKETAIVFLPLLVLHDLSFRKRGWKLRSSFRRYLPYLAAVALYLGMRTRALGHFAPVDMHPDLTTYQCVINVFPLFVQHLWALVWPVDLNVFHVFRPVRSILEPRTLVGTLVSIGYLAGLYVSWKRNRLVFFALVLVFVPLLPLFYIRAIGPVVFAEQHLYLPSFGVALLLGKMLVWIASQRTSIRFAVVFVFLLSVCLLSLVTVKRNPVWKDNLSLWSDAVEKSPDSAYVHESLAGALLGHGRMDQAIEHYLMVLEVDPNPSARTYNNLGIAYAESGWAERAIESFDQALSIDPGYARAHVGRGIAFHEKGWADRAIAEFRTAIELDPYLADAHYNLGVAYAEKGDYPEAEEAMRRASALNPGYYEKTN